MFTTKFLCSHRSNRALSLPLFGKSQWTFGTAAGDFVHIFYLVGINSLKWWRRTSGYEMLLVSETVEKSSHFAFCLPAPGFFTPRDIILLCMAELIFPSSYFVQTIDWGVWKIDIFTLIQKSWECPFYSGSCDRRVSLPIRRASLATSARDIATAQELCIRRFISVPVCAHRINYPGLLWKPSSLPYRKGWAFLAIEKRWKESVKNSIIKLFLKIWHRS